MKYALFLDDMRGLTKVGEIFPIAVHMQNMAVVVVRNYDQFTEAVENLGLPFAVSFDHDLHQDHYPHSAAEQEEDHVIDYHGDERYARNKTGWHCAAWLKEKCARADWDYPAINIHSRNVPGAKYIARLFEHEGGIECSREKAD